MKPVLFCGAAVLVFAVPAAADELDEQGRPLIVVTATPAGYAAAATVTATKTPTDLIDLPQSISILTRDRLDDQALLSIGEALRYVPGVTVGQGEGHRDQPTIRGNNTTADFFVDGIRDDVQYFRDFYNVERLEVLKGPNALAFGRGGGGGVINRVSKTPGDTAFVAGDAAIDTHGGYRLGADLNQPLGGGAALRVNAVYEDGQSFRDFYGLERYAINPVLGVTFGDTALGASYEYVRDERVIDRGVPAVDPGVAGQPRFPLTGFDRTFFGVPGINHADFAAHIVTLSAAHRFGDALTLKTRLLYGDYDKRYTNVFAATALSPANAVGIEAYADPTGRRNLFSQTDLVWTVATGGIRHTLLAGIELGNQTTRNQRINGFFSPTVNTTRVTVNFTDPLVVPPLVFRAGPGNRSVRTEADILGLYLQDQIALGEQFELVAGLRFDRFKLDFTNRLTAATFQRTDALWSPRLGAIFKPLPRLAFYAGYSRSYLPQSGDQFLSLDLTSAALQPERFENYEIGAKWDIVPALHFTAALYRLDRTNTRAPGATAGTVVLTGEQRSKGLELSLAGRLADNWHLTAGYALQDAEIRSTTSAAPVGRQVAQVPRHQVSLWNRYDFGARFGVGAGVVHQSKSFASISNLVVLPSFTRVDAALFATLGGGFEAQVNFENILDEDYFPTAHNDSNISPGAPTAARLTVRKRF